MVDVVNPATPPFGPSGPDVWAILKDLVEQLDWIGIPEWRGAEGLTLEAARAAIAVRPKLVVTHFGPHASLRICQNTDKAEPAGMPGDTPWEAKYNAFGIEVVLHDTNAEDGCFVLHKGKAMYYCSDQYGDRDTESISTEEDTSSSAVNSYEISELSPIPADQVAEYEMLFPDEEAADNLMAEKQRLVAYHMDIGTFD